MLRTILIVLAVATVCTPLRAQDELRVEPGDRIRVTAPQAFRSPVVGTLVGRAPDMLTVARRTGGGADTVNIPVAVVSQLEVSRGHLSGGQGLRRGALRGATAGVVVGAILGGALALGADEQDGKEANEFAEAAQMGAGFGAIGLVVGGLLGTGERERWERILPPTVSVGVVHRAPSLMVSLRI